MAEWSYDYPSSMVSLIFWERLFFQSMQIIFGWSGWYVGKTGEMVGDNKSFSTKKSRMFKFNYVNSC